MKTKRFIDMATLNWNNGNGFPDKGPGTYDMYQDPYSMRWNTSHQDARIKELEIELEGKNEQKNKDVKNLVAYFYKRY